MTVNETVNTEAKKSRLPLFAGIGCGVIFLCILGCVGFYFFFIRGIRGEPANTDTIQKVTQVFVAALHDNQFDSAQNMFSDKIRPTISTSDLESLAKEKPISDFQRLSVCEFQVNFGGPGRQIVGYGLLRYEGGAIIFESTLIQDEDSVWRMYGFFLQPNMTATPSGACKIN